MSEIDWRTYMRGAPGSSGGAGYADVVRNWLAEGGLERGETVTGGGEPISVVVFHDHDDPDGPRMYAVPDRLIDDGLRAALDSFHRRTFATEDIDGDRYAGGLWLLALVKKMAPNLLDQFADQVPGIDREALLAARRAEPWQARSLRDDGPVREAEITHCYAATLAH
jgi:hypothetical protein